MDEGRKKGEPMQHLDAEGKPSSQDMAVVSVSLPVQASGRGLAVRGRPFTDTQMKGMVGGEFTPKRPVIRLAMEDADAPGVEVTSFEPAITIKVRYTPQDLRKAEGGRLVLGYWYDNHWITFKEDKHRFRLEPDPHGQSGGFGVIELSSWVDPPVAWG